MSTVPQLVLIDRSGVIRYQSPLNGGDGTFFQEATLRARIEELLKEPAGKVAGKPGSKKKSN
jgi:hypothetical protein